MLSRARPSQRAVILRSRAFLVGLATFACAGERGSNEGALDLRLGPALARDPALVEPAGTGERLAFSLEEGFSSHHFLRQGAVAAHLVVRSGAEPRLIVAFPAGNQGIGVWFSETAPAAKLWVSPVDATANADEALTAVARREKDRRFLGVRTHLRSTARQLTARLTLLANLRTVRDYGYGTCLENRADFPLLRNEVVEWDRTQRSVRVRREQIGGGFALELWFRAGRDTELAVEDRVDTARPACRRGAQPSKVIEVTGSNGIELELTAMSNEEPLTPIPRQELVRGSPEDVRALQALEFLSYAEKLQAGSWRFLTYFGRDTLLSVRLLMPVLQTRVVESALASVLSRVNLDRGTRDLGSRELVEIGEVAHEEEIGDYAALNNVQSSRAGDPRSPVYDYKMIDDDFLLAPVLAQHFAQQDIHQQPSAPAAIDAFLDQSRPDGKRFRDAVKANLELVLRRARPFADDVSEPRRKKHKLVALKPGVGVGQWRDSEMGIAFGRYPFDVNVALVPAALEAAASLFERLGSPDSAAEARRIERAWQGVDGLFQIELPLAEARANIAAYARSAGLADPANRLEAMAGTKYRYAGIALDASGAPLPILNSDQGFVLEFTKPSEASLTRIASTIGNDFPAGLLSPIGLFVASPALAAPAASVIDPKDLRKPHDDAPVRLRELFTRSHYHGTVVWSWQQALFASGLRRQLERTDLALATRRKLARLECRLWIAIEAAKALRIGELWSFRADPVGGIEARPFGLDRADADESNAIQLWSTVYLAVRRPTPEQNPECASR